MATAGLLSLAGTGGALQITSQIRQQQFIKDMAQRNSEAAIQRGGAEAENIRRDARRRIATTKAAFGAAGGGINESVIADQILEGELRAVTAERTGQIIARDEDITRGRAQRNQQAFVFGQGIEAGVGILKGFSQGQSILGK